MCGHGDRCWRRKMATVSKIALSAAAKTAFGSEAGPSRADPSADAGIERLLPIKSVMAITSWSRTSINRGIAEGWFPKPVKLSGRHRIVWRESDIRAYVEAQLRQERAA
jgi:predicted DNA-binding transcriptional regulator AlpA